jgi:hypothetical protein
MLEFWTSTYAYADVEVAEEEGHPHGLGLNLDHHHHPALRARSVAPHSARLFALRLDRLTEPQYLGSDLHFSQGWELRALEWVHREDAHLEVRVELDAGKEVEGAEHHVWLSLPGSSAVQGLEGAPGAVRVAAGIDRVWKVPLPKHTARVFALRVAYPQPDEGSGM